MSKRVADRRLLAGLLCLGFVAAACGSGSAQSTAPTAAPSTLAVTTSSVGATNGSAAGGGGTPNAARAAAVYPGDEWTTVDAKAAGFDPAKLDQIVERAKSGGSNCFLVTRHGKLVGEWYWNDTTPASAQEVWSATKSYTSTLVGIAQSEGKLDIHDKASTYLPEWAGTPSDAVTVQNLLQNDSGRHWDYQTDYLKMAGGAPDKTAFAVGLTQDAPPGTVWAYNNSAIQTLSGVLKKATGQEAAEYAQEKLLGPIGMKDSVMKKDPSGGTLTFIGLSSTCRDMARFGYLMLNKGNWDGKQIVPTAWVQEATGQSSQKLNAAYGYLWWLNRKGHLANPIQPTTGQEGGDQAEGQMVPGAPDDMFWALGLGNQIISVDPGSDTVVVRLGPSPNQATKGATPFTQKDTAAVVTDALVTK